VGVRGRVQITSLIDSTVLHFNHSYDRRPPLCERRGFLHIDQHSHTARVIPGDSEDYGRLPMPRPAPRRGRMDYDSERFQSFTLLTEAAAVLSETDSQESTAPLFGLIFTRQANVQPGKSRNATGTGATFARR
jgi:hypothetical protein